MKNVIVIGKMGVGKDTFAEFLVKNHNYVQTSIAGRLKQIAELLYPDVFATGDRNQKRSVLQKLGDLLRSQNMNIFNDALIREISVKKISPVVISDVRYTMEYDFFVSKGFIPVRVNVDDNIRFERLFKRDGSYPTLDTLNHRSENDICVAANKYFYEVDNNGTQQDLEKQAADFFKAQVAGNLAIPVGKETVMSGAY